MKKLLFPILLSIFTLPAFAQLYLTEVGQKVPAFTFEIEKGKKASIKDYKGKLVLINLFATWCPPCNTELPEVQTKIWNKYGNNKKFALLVFGREEGWEKLEPFKKRKGFTFPILPDLDKHIFSLFADSGIPRNIIIDGTGKIIYQSAGYSSEEFEKMLFFIEQQMK